MSNYVIRTGLFGSNGLTLYGDSSEKLAITIDEAWRLEDIPETKEPTSRIIQLEKDNAEQKEHIEHLEFEIAELLKLLELK